MRLRYRKGLVMKNIFVTDMEVIVVDDKYDKKQDAVVLDYGTLRKYDKGKLIPFYTLDTHLRTQGYVEIGKFLEEKEPTSKRWVLCELYESGELAAIRNVNAVWEDFYCNKLKFTEIVKRFEVIDGLPVEID
jgi:hypothetical protein